VSERNPEYTEWITGVFDRAAPTYDRVGPRVFSHFGNRLVELSGLSSGASVLDVGCGRGAVLFPAAQKVGASGCVIGVDRSRGMLTETAAEIEQRGLSNVELHLMDVEKGLSFPDEHFDFVFCGFSLYYFDRLNYALSECVRVLKPGGMFLASTFGRGRDDRWKGFRRVARPYMSKLSPAPKNESRGLRDPAEIEEVLAAAGLVEIEVIPEAKEFYFIDADEWWAFEWSQGNRSLWERLDPPDLEQFKQEAMEALTQIKKERGIPRPMPMLLTRAHRPSHSVPGE
jgi:ubiquinone/menaquinone biosynthesis C-methylase UbiE